MSSEESDGDMMSVAEVAQLLNVTRGRVRQMLLAGQLVGQRVGRDWVIMRSDVVAFQQAPRRGVGRPPRV